jgi:alanine dehydrogenase
MSIGRLLSLGIRREVKNKWERRVPLTPSHVQKLVKDLNATVYVQPSTKRIFPDSAYVQVTSDLYPSSFSWSIFIESSTKYRLVLV